MNQLREAIGDAIEKPVDVMSESGWPQVEFEQAISDVLEAVIEALPNTEDFGYPVLEKGSEFSTPRDYRKAGYKTAIEDFKQLLLDAKEDK